jgi:hypothetical protein
MQSSSTGDVDCSPRGDLLFAACVGGRTDMCVGLNIPFYIDMTMFIGEFHDQGWPQGV